MSLFLIISSDESKTLITNAFFFTRNEDYNFEQSKDFKNVHYFFVSAADR